jgi:hypothetical protein
VARLALDLAHLPPGEPVRVELDRQNLDKQPWPDGPARLYFQRVGNTWFPAKAAALSLKGPHRYGPFKEAFRNRVLFVYGTAGSPEENAWSYARARYDAETFWYRGNGAVELMADADLDANKEKDRNVILYGHAECNAAWKALLEQSPVQVRRGVIQVGDRREKGDDLACLFVQPRPGSETALVGVVGGSGLNGLRLTERLAYFVSGCAYPDCLILGPDVLTQGSEGVRVAGFFGPNWGVSTGDWVWKNKAE